MSGRINQILNKFSWYLEYLLATVRSWRDVLHDFCHGRYFGGVVKSRYAHLGAHRTQSSSYHVLRAVFQKYPIKGEDVLVDVGCGKGRVLHWWLAQGYTNRIIGLELDVDIARQTAKTFRNERNVRIISGDARANIPAEATVFYFYNSFNEEVLRAFKDRLKAMFLGKREITFIYANYENIDAFRHDPDWEMECTRFRGLPSPEGLAWREIDLGIFYPVAIITFKQRLAA